jgi:hypothetical protein
VNNASHRRTKAIMQMSYLGAHEIDLTFHDLDGLFDGESRCEKTKLELTIKKKKTQTKPQQYLSEAKTKMSF